MSRETAFAAAVLAAAVFTNSAWAHTYFCCQYDVPKCDGVQDPPDIPRASAACQANGGNPKPGLACVGKFCGLYPGTFKPSGTFDNPETEAGVYTEPEKDGSMTHHYYPTGGVELVYHVSATTSNCTKIATIQVIWRTDAGGQVRHASEVSNPSPNAAEQDKCDADGGYGVDFDGDQTTPYYQDDGGGKLTNGKLGSSDGNGGGGAAHISDWPSRPKDGWTKHFEVWTVCIEGENIGEVLAGAVWHIGPDDKATFDDKNPKEPSQHFKDAVHGFEKGHPSFTEPGGGFQW
jgi:hypothetical protein